ncbi:hypothetical protein [Frankia sp. R43]|uniref:hypothetical protein n=1 Tax=Frankia sp. R43 TaxID=269536 RepID=UPI000AB0A03E|nr:hypothetical protein [Frankia sp. R43]
MAVGHDEPGPTPVDGRGRAVTTPDQSQALYEAVEHRRIQRGWLAGAGGTSSTLYSLRDGRPALLTGLSKWSKRMEWTPRSALRVAVHGEEPTPLEELPARLRREIEARCAERGVDPATEIPVGIWTALTEGLLPALPSADDLFDALDRGSLPSATVQALLDVDGAMAWRPGSAQRVAVDGQEPEPVESDRRLVFEFPQAPPAVTVEEWYQVSGRATTVAPQMSPEDRGRLAAVVEEMLRDWERRQGG